MTSQESTHQPSSKRAGASKITRLVIPFVLILGTICVGSAGLYRYSTYNSLCLDNSPNNLYAYVLRSINPDIESTEAFIKDQLLSQLAQTTLEPGYPFVTSQVQNARSPYLDFIEQNFGLDLEQRGIRLWEPRTVYSIHLDSEDTRLVISYHRLKTDQDQRAFFGDRVYVIPSWSAAQPRVGEDPVIIVAVNVETQKSMDKFLPTTLFVKKALDQIRKCQP